MLGQRGQILPAGAQRRDLERDDRKPIVQVLSEGAVFHALGQVAMGCSQDTRTSTFRADARSDAQHLAVHQHTEQLRLKPAGHLAGLVQE